MVSESVWDYPRPPRVEPLGRIARVEFDGVTIAHSRFALRVLETSHPPAIYFPPSDVRQESLRAASGITVCEWKGLASYFDIVGERHTATAAAWTYADPRLGYRMLEGCVAFYPARVDACYIGDERVQAQPGDFYGGWITAEITGPFKGAAGTTGWQVRDPSRAKAADPRLAVVVGDVLRRETVAAALETPVDAVINATGADPLKLSNLVTTAATAIVGAMEAAGPRPYIASTGTGQMPKTLFGSVSIAILRRTPVGHAIRDHEGTFQAASGSRLDWLLAACPYIRDVPERGRQQIGDRFPGGFKIVGPGDVADFLVSEVRSPRGDRIHGIWY